MTATLQETVTSGNGSDGYDEGRFGSADGDGDDYSRLGAGEAELYANNPTDCIEPAPNGESYGETYRMADVSARPRRRVGGIAMYGVSLQRELPQRLMPPSRSPFDRGVGGIAIGPVELN